MTTLTVTATQGGSTGASLLLRVYVITGAKLVASQTGGAAGNSFGTNNNTWTASITTTAGSNVYMGASPSPTGTVATGSNMTVVDQVNDATNNITYVTCKALNVTSGATTRGFTCGGAAGSFSLFEILASGTLAEDGSAPAQVNGNGTSNLSVTTASFTPPPGSLLVAVIGSSGGAAQTTMTVTDNLGTHLNWTAKREDNVAGDDYAGIWIADVPAGGGPAVAQAQPGQTWKRRFHHPQTVPSVAAVAAAAVNGQQQPLETKTHPRRYSSRAAIYWIPVETQNAVPPGPVNGQVQALETKTHPRRYPARVSWKGFTSTTTNPAPGSAPDLQAKAHPRRYPSRAVWRGFLSTTVNNTSVTSFTAQISVIRRPYPARGQWRGLISRTTNKAPQVQPDGVVYRRRPARSVAYWTPVVTVNATGANVPGQAPPLQAKVHPRRYPFRAMWKGFVSSTTNPGPGNTQDLATRQPRRYPSRAVWRGWVSRTTNPAAANTQDLATRQLPRRYPARVTWKGFTSSTTNPAPQVQPDGVVYRRRAARAVAYWTPVETTNTLPANVPGSVQELQTKTHPRRYPSRVVWRGVTARTTNTPIGNQPGGLVRRRSSARAVVIGRPPRGAPFIPPPGQAPKNLVIRHRKRERAYLRWHPVSTTNAPPPPFGKGYSTGTSVGEAASMIAAVGEAASDQATVTRVASSQGSVQ